MREELMSNFAYIQNKIDDIKKMNYIDIKQISDLQRFIEMQKNIIYAITLLECD